MRGKPAMGVGKLRDYVSIQIQKAMRRLHRGPSRVRRESNVWLRHHTSSIQGDVLSIGTGTDEDGEGGKYRDYFKACSSYTTSDFSGEFHCDLILDIRSMPEVQDSSFDCVFCNSVLEHVDDYLSALKEITRILKPAGILLLGLPFRQPLHKAPHDYWRFTEEGIRYLLQDDYEILEMAPMDNSVLDFPSAHLVEAKRR